MKLPLYCSPFVDLLFLLTNGLLLHQDHIQDVFSCGVGHKTKNSANVFSACCERRLKETERGDWESPPLYIFPQRQHERGGVAGR